jgi:spermidine synthase
MRNRGLRKGAARSARFSARSAIGPAGKALLAEMGATLIVARAKTPGGGEMILRQRGADFEIRIDGRELMSSRGHFSEEAMARLACAEVADRAAPRVLIGGLGMGYTLRAALDALPGAASVTVAELVRELVAWNRGPLAPLAGHPLEDPRVVLQAGDVGTALARPEPPFDAILLDVDNGPEAVTVAGNHRLYSPEGLALARAALRPGGVLAIWSADRSPPFLARLDEAGFAARAVAVAALGEAGGPEHTIFLAVRGG